MTDIKYTFTDNLIDQEKLLLHYLMHSYQYNREQAELFILGLNFFPDHIKEILYCIFDPTIMIKNEYTQFNDIIGRIKDTLRDYSRGIAILRLLKFKNDDDLVTLKTLDNYTFSINLDYYKALISEVYFKLGYAVANSFAWHGVSICEDLIDTLDKMAGQSVGGDYFANLIGSSSRTEYKDRAVTSITNKLLEVISKKQFFLSISVFKQIHYHYITN